MTTRNDDPNYYIDWACRITEEVCLRSNRRLSHEGMETFRSMYEETAKEIAQRPAIFRANSAEMHYWLAEAAQLMVKSAEYAGASTIEPEHIRASTMAISHMRTTLEDSPVTSWTGCGLCGGPPKST